MVVVNYFDENVVKKAFKGTMTKFSANLAPVACFHHSKNYHNLHDFLYHPLNHVASSYKIYDYYNFSDL